MREPGSRDDGGYAAPSDLQGFGGGPVPPHLLIHEGKKQVELASEAFDYSGVRHTVNRTSGAKFVKLLLPAS